MSYTTVSADVLPPREKQIPAPQERAPRALAAPRWLGKSIWALADQVLISGTNFVTLVLTARALHHNEFGAFSIIYSILLFANIFQSTLITQAHNVLGVTRSGRDYRRYTYSAAVGQLVMVLIEAAVVIPVAIFADVQGLSWAAMMVALIPAIIGWQLQEFVRRVLYTEHRFGDAFFNDILSYGGQTAIIVALYAAKVHWDFQFTGAVALYVLAATSFAGVILGLWQIRHSLLAQFAPHDLWENWHFGKWLAGGELLGWASSLQMQIWWAALLLGTWASADLRAAQILFGPTRVIAFFLGTVLPIRFARTLHGEGSAALHRQIKTVYAILVPALGSYCLLLALFPRMLLRLVYGPQYLASDTVSVLVLYSISAFLSYMQMVVAAALTAGRRTPSIFAGSVWGCCLGLVLSPVLIKSFGANGAIISIIATTLIVTVMFIRSYRASVGKVGFELILKPQRAGIGSAAIVAPGTEAIVAERPSRLEARGALLLGVLDLLEREKLSYAILHGYEQYPGNITSDVDCLVAHNELPRLKQILLGAQREMGFRIVQWFDDPAAQFVVLATHDEAGEPSLLQLHVASDYEVEGRAIFRGEEILQTRRLHARQPFWIPAAEVEFACVLANRLIKGMVEDRHARQLSQLHNENPAGCERQVARLFGEHKELLDAVVAADAAAMEELAPTLRLELLSRAAALPRRLARLGRRIRRWLQPRSGLHVVFLGPDGVGKSTVIDAVREDVSTAFLRTNYQTFAPSLIPSVLQKPKRTPHELPPRALPGSLIKAAWWFICYTLGYFFVVYPVRARGGMVLNHRYLLDAMIDSRRYRYSGPKWLLGAICAISPKPSLVILLDASAEVIQRRKQEVSLDEIRRQRDGYRTLVGGLRNGHVVDASQPLEKVVGDVDEIILATMHGRFGSCNGSDV